MNIGFDVYWKQQEGEEDLWPSLGVLGPCSAEVGRSLVFQQFGHFEVLELC